MDREAFDDFAGVLRAIVDDAHALGGSIESGAVSAKKTLDALERSESALRPKIDMAARVLASMDERIARLESLLTRAERGAQSLEQAESRVADMIDTRVRALESRIEDVVAGADGWLVAARFTAAGVTPVDGRRPYLDQDILGPRHRFFHLLNAQDIGASGLRDDNGTHTFSLRQLSLRPALGSSPAGISPVSMRTKRTPIRRSSSRASGSGKRASLANVCC
ncbi:MAG: hypothetical protein IIB55_07915 [Planctomycetes bacterium]|nr:hypothetical protein [Planctomycetota bacterium]